MRLKQEICISMGILGSLEASVLRTHKQMLG